MKKIFIIFLLQLLIAGCTGNTSAAMKNDTVPELDSAAELLPVTTEVSVLDDERVMKAFYEIDLLVRNDDPAFMADFCTAAALVRIVSIDGADTWNASLNRNGAAYTYGTLEVIEPLKGDLHAGQTCIFTRTGGLVTWEQYAAAQIPESIEKQERLMNENGTPIPEYVYEAAYNDILPEEGKTYLAYFESNESAPVTGAYRMTGFAGGLREYDETADLLFNNFTSKWEQAGTVTETFK